MEEKIKNVEEKLAGYVTRDMFNSTIYELKNNMSQIQHEQALSFKELKNDTHTLNNTLTNLNSTIAELNNVMVAIRDDASTTKEKLTSIEKSNISRDNKIENLEDFRETAEKHISGRFKEVVALIIGVGTIFSGIVIAIIQLAPLFF